MTRMHPQGNRLLIKVSEKKDFTTDAGLFIPSFVSSLTDNFVIGQVVEVGNGKKLTNGRRSVVDFTVGQKVFLSRFAGVRLWIDERPFLLVETTEVLCAVE